MVPHLHLDRVDNLSCTEVRGVMRSLTRKALVQWKPAEVNPAHRSHELLGESLKFLETQGIIPNQPLGLIRNRDERFAPLILVNRDASVAQEDPCYFNVILKYDHIMDGPNQTLLKPSSGLIFGKGRTSIVEKTTNFFYPFGIRDAKDPTKNRFPIIVAHTFPTYETGIAATPHDPNYPRTIFQGGEISIPYPQSTYRVEGLVATARPAKLAHFMVATVSENIWQGLPSITWICSEVQWEVNDPSDRVGGIGKSPVYKMSFEFQHNIDTWDPAVVFIDQRTGRPPFDVQIGQFEADSGTPAKFGGPGPGGVLRMVLHPNPKAGISTQVPAGLFKVPALRRLDYDAFLGALFEGAAPPEFD